MSKGGSPVRPMGYRVVVRLDAVEEKTEGGIIIATAEENKRRQTGQIWATIEEIGPTAFKGAEYQYRCVETQRILKEDPPKVGDKVLMRRYGGQPIGRVGERNHEMLYHVIADTDILGVVKDGENVEMKTEEG